MNVELTMIVLMTNSAKTMSAEILAIIFYVAVEPSVKQRHIRPHAIVLQECKEIL